MSRTNTKDLLALIPSANDLLVGNTEHTRYASEVNWKTRSKEHKSMHPCDEPRMK